MLNWWERRRLILVGISGWTINWTDIGEEESGEWMYFESASGRRKVRSTHVPYLYKGMGGETRLPGYSESKAWECGGPVPKHYISIKERE